MIMEPKIPKNKKRLIPKNTKYCYDNKGIVKPSYNDKERLVINKCYFLTNDCRCKLLNKKLENHKKICGIA